MKSEIIIRLIKILYQAGLRELVIKAIDNPDESWDDTILLILDTLLGYKND